MKKAGNILLIVAVVLAGLYFARNFIVKTAIEMAVRPILGTGLSIGKLDMDVLRSRIAINDMKVYNPAGFPDKVMIDIPEVYVDYKMGALLKKNIYLKEIRFEVKEFIMVQNKDGEANFNSIKIVQDYWAKKDAQPAEKKSSSGPSVSVQDLSLKVGRVVYKDYSAGGEPSIKESDINLDEHYEDIESLSAIFNMILIKTIIKASAAFLKNADWGELQDIAFRKLKMATEALGSTADDSAQKAIGSTTDNIISNLNILWVK